MTLLILKSFTLNAQNQDKVKRIITPEDYNKWHELVNFEISDDGKWLSFRKKYTMGKDTVILINTSTRTELILNNHRSGRFVNSHSGLLYIFQKTNSGVKVLNLEKKNSFSIKKASDFVLAADSSTIATFTYNVNQTKNVSLISTDGKKINNLENVTDFQFSDSGHFAAYTINEENFSEIIITDLKKNTSSNLKLPGKHLLKSIIWNNHDSAIAFFDEIEEIKLLYWNRISSELKMLDREKFQTKKNILSTNMYFSDDGKKLIFDVEPSQLEDSIYMGANIKAYHKIESLSPPEPQVWKTIWVPESEKIIELGNDEFPEIIINPQQKFAIAYNSHKKKISFDNQSYATLIAIDLNTGQRNEIVKNQNISYNWLHISPTGNYLSYFKDGNWWVYDFNKKENVNLTYSVSTKFYSETNTNPERPKQYGSPGWLEDDLGILLYDEFDVWKTALDGSNLQRLTKGRENKRQFRVVKSRINSQKVNRSSFENAIFHKKEPILLSESFEDIPFSYSLYLEKIEHLVTLPGKKIKGLLKAKKSNTFIYITESANSPPVIMLIEPTLKSIELYQSNSHFKNYLIGKTEVIHYKTPSDRILKGILRYPDNFKEHVTYPMIVNIYERKSPERADYKNPSLFNYDGFNYRNYTASGYFVLEPDINYVSGAPGKSAVNCITSAVQEVLRRQFVDENRLGIIGHSFGGYQTAYIIAHSSIFTAAVTGAPVTDLTSFYLSMSKEKHIPEFWRFEKQQFRMGYSFFENKSAYLANSPIHHADKIDTTLLIWTGEKDNVVPPSQSMELYLALLRLKKDVTFYIYLNEGHALLSAKNQVDLSNRIKLFFDNNLTK